MGIEESCERSGRGARRRVLPQADGGVEKPGVRSEVVSVERTNRLVRL